MKIFFQFLVGIIFIGHLFGCATVAWQSKNLLASSSREIPDFHEIKGVGFVDQSDRYCGPAVLAMALRWGGQDISIEESAALVYSPFSEGSFQSDMISASRRRGMMAVTIHNLSDLLTEVAADHPVIVFENLSFSWAPRWHYALIVGYDLSKQEIIMHSGHDAFFRWDIEKFERSWQLGEYWGLVVLPAGELAISASELAHVTAAVGLENVKKYDEAEISYLKILKKWPASLVAMIGLANVYYQKGNRAEAVHWLHEALRLYPESQIAQHNLFVAESD